MGRGWNDVIINFFCFSCQVKFTCWSKFYVNIITYAGVMTNYFYKRLTRNLEIGNTLVWGLVNIWRLGRVRVKLQNARVIAFAVYELLRVDQQGAGNPPPRLELSYPSFQVIQKLIFLITINMGKFFVYFYSKGNPSECLVKQKETSKKKQAKSKK